MKFIVYTKSNCRYCEMAKADISDFLYKYAYQQKDKTLLEVINITDTGFTVEDLKEKFSNLGLPAPRSVPCIFYKEEAKSDIEDYIGGYSELKTFLDSLKGKFDANN